MIYRLVVNHEMVISGGYACVNNGFTVVSIWPELGTFAAENNDRTDELDPQLAFNNFTDLFFTLYDIHCPIQRTKFNRNLCKVER